MNIGKSTLRLIAVVPLVLFGQAGCGSHPSPNSGSVAHKEDLKMRSVGNLQLIGCAIVNFRETVGYTPTAGLPKGMEPPLAMPSPYSWRVAILPFIDQQDVWAKVPQGFALVDSSVPESVSKTPIKVYQNLNDPKWSPTDTPYRAFVGNGAAFEWGAQPDYRELKGKLDKTILIAEFAEPISWSSVNDFNYDPKKPLPKLGVFPGGFHALMMDGSVWWIPSDTDEKIIRAMIERTADKSFTMPGTRVAPAIATN